jgi:hypothetical protein
MASDEQLEGGTIGRRQLLAVLGAGAVASLAGCSGLTNQSFEAAEVGLSTEGQERLQLGELGRDTLTFEQSAADGNISVTITSHTAVYSRAAGLGGQ